MTMEGADLKHVVAEAKVSFVVEGETRAFDWTNEIEALQMTSPSTACSEGLMSGALDLAPGVPIHKASRGKAGNGLLI